MCFSPKLFLTLGHTEKAVSIAQAILELNWYCPAALELAPLAWKKDELSRYWASNLPHVGEKVFCNEERMPSILE